ncbi:hypothetical protein [Sphingomonas gellani]|nr:hypothetical protein [Sphingomonas gellani]
MTMLAGGALVAAAALVVPGAMGAAPARDAAVRRAAASPILGTFTPVAADPRLAAMLARGGMDAGSFRFTPAEVRSTNQAVTVAVRARTNRAIDNSRVASAPAASVTTLSPVAYNLGVAVGWKRFAVAGDVSRLDMATRPGSREAADVAVSYAGNRFTGRVQAGADRPLGDAPKLVEPAPSYSVDLGGSYRLTRNLDVTAGVRYRAERERLNRFDSDRRDSQAVYVGTAFRF